MNKYGKTRLIGFALLLSGTLVGGTALAEPIVVVPGMSATVEGSGEALFPFDVGASLATSARYQQVYAASAFGALIQPENITQISFRPDADFAGSSSAFSTTLPSIQIDLSTTSVNPDSLSTAFADNVGTDDTAVFKGPLSLSSADTGPLNGPRDFDITIDLPNHFRYDPSQGNLLLDVRNFGGGITTVFDLQNAPGDSVSRVGTNGLGGGTVDSTMADFADTGGLVTQFAFAVPEPPGLLIFGFGLTVLAVFGRKRRRV
jgi:hypothetical protein